MQGTEHTKIRHRQSSLQLAFNGVRALAVGAGISTLCSAAAAFQTAPMGSAFESKLTNETENSLATVAGRLGVLIKGRVHEEIQPGAMGYTRQSLHPRSIP